MSFRIEPRNIIETGIDRIEFDASKVKLISDTNDDDPSWGNEAEKQIIFAYEDAEICQKITDLSYSFRWGKTCVQGAWDRWKAHKFTIVKKATTKLRKKKGGKEWTDNSRIAHLDNAKRLDKFDLEWAIEEFEYAFHEFNQWYEDEQRKAVKRVYGGVSSYKFDEPEVVTLQEQYSELRKQIQELNVKITQTKYNVLLKKLKADKMGVSPDFKEDLIEELEKNKLENKDDIPMFLM